MTTASITVHTSAAEALATQLPTPAPLVALPLAAGATPVVVEHAVDAVTASFVGSTSADLALVLVDLDAITAAAGTDSPFVSVTDVVRPALEAAAAVLGVGVLAEARREPATSLVTDQDAVVFELVAGGTAVGWFALRVRGDEDRLGGPGNAGRIAPVGGSVAANLGRINNVEMTLTVEIGRARMSVRDVLGLEPGAVVELDRSAGAPADVLLNGRLIAHGEVVVVDQDYAIRITQILDVAEGA